MTLEVLVIGLIRIAGSLPVLRWPLAGGLLAIAVDLSDLLLRDVLDLGGIPDYQAFDKWIDQVYLGAFLVVALRWAGPERAIAVGLYLFRLVGFVAFELTGERALLLLFPNVFELWFLCVAAVHRFRPGFVWRPVATWPCWPSCSRSRSSRSGRSTEPACSTASVRSTSSRWSGAG